MKKDFDLKLTISVVSLFISLALIIFGASNNYCLFFGLLFMAGALFSFSFFITKRIANSLKEIQTELNNIENGINPDGTIYTEEDLEAMLGEEKRLKKQRRNCRISFNAAAVMLCLVAIFVLI